MAPHPNLPTDAEPATWARFGIWQSLGLVIYFVYSLRHSTLNV